MLMGSERAPRYPPIPIWLTPRNTYGRLTLGVVRQSPIPNPQSPIPNPQSLYLTFLRSESGSFTDAIASGRNFPLEFCIIFKAFSKLDVAASNSFAES